ncbi:group 1 truncated hemoglobin [Nostoc sp. CENA67]|uniref:Group 1 truncated hemoglobin n=1 Tax=Amazonocrinis nigriterrae CENA67 TaxID=2794033 RepID=A0A8J7I1B9_9NOST|nr:group 1 truncated hemoglobin [Amazonocrinis nigriterrae]MBH8567063.1 group 1 truncated hemoglobin [Amazonocrinis nigriterrae CENA67]
MKIQNLLTKFFWLTLACITVIVVTIFKLSPSLARSTATPPAQLSTADVTIAYSGSQGLVGNSLYKRLGGYNGIAAVIDDAAQYIFNDPQIGKYFIGLSTNSKQRLRELLIAQFCEAAGGPCIYTGRTMKLSHSGIGGGLTNSEFNAFAYDIGLALKDNKVNQKEREEVLAFVESLRDHIVEK